MKEETFYRTIVESPQWQDWREEQSKRLSEHNEKHSKVYTGCWDMAEVEELGLISPGHWQDFIRFLRQEVVKEILPEEKGDEFSAIDYQRTKIPNVKGMIGQILGWNACLKEIRQKIKNK